ncbi:hypothetical protein PISL3812_02744 [Talaromyces islandicus]|uniref:SnoaL-like domain-containing protein n=1 Tax=Talaromyces islandicus TaxID=28573 RepID=A0A0U1LQQ5_TALIS|nr:hypothetical protein PISL3812_02744 [Talaromyces islandicus]
MAYEISTPPNTPPTLEPHASTLKNFMQSFYATSDNPTAHEEYAREYFTADATLIMGGKGAKGHTPTKIFFGGEDDLMLFGKVAYVMKKSAELEGSGGGRQQQQQQQQQEVLELDWSARAEFVFDEEKKPRMRYYQVYLDTAAQMAAAQKV